MGLRHRCMTSLGKPSCDWRSWFLCWNAEAFELFVSSSYYFDEVLNSFRWCLQPDGKAGPAQPASGSSGSEQVKSKLTKKLWWSILTD